MAKFIYNAFISYSSVDLVIVAAIVERLKKEGLKVWFDKWEIHGGDNIPAKIDEGLENSRHLILCMSANAFNSDWARLESYTFLFRDPLNKERRLIPIRLDSAPIKGTLKQFHYINFFQTDFEEACIQLIKACKKH